MKKPSPPRLVTVAIFTTITIIFWVFLSLYRVIVSKPPVEVPENMLTTLVPKLNMSNLGDIQNKLFFDQDVTTNTPIPTVAVNSKTKVTTSVTPTPNTNESLQSTTSGNIQGQ